MPELIVVKRFKRQNDGNGDKSKCYQLNRQDPNWLKTYKYAKKDRKKIERRMLIYECEYHGLMIPAGTVVKDRWYGTSM